jgi:hypothetical protein
MDKTAEQQDADEVTKSIIGDNKIATAFWKQSLSAASSKVIDSIRALHQLKQDEAQLNFKVPNAIGQGTFQRLANDPESAYSLDNIAQFMKALANIPEIKSNSQTIGPINDYLAQHSKLVTWLTNWKPQPAPQKPVANKKPKQVPPQTRDKIKKLQTLLGVEATGIWNNQSNTAFLGWLKANGWDKYISGDRFTGKLDDAIRAIMVEKAGQPPAQEAGAETNLNQRQSSRLERLKKLGI